MLSLVRFLCNYLTRAITGLRYLLGFFENGTLQRSDFSRNLKICPFQDFYSLSEICQLLFHVSDGFRLCSHFFFLFFPLGAFEPIGRFLHAEAI